MPPSGRSASSTDRLDDRVIVGHPGAVDSLLGSGHVQADNPQAFSLNALYQGLPVFEAGQAFDVLDQQDVVFAGGGAQVGPDEHRQILSAVLSHLGGCIKMHRTWGVALTVFY